MVTRTPGGEGRADLWSLSDWARQQYEAATGTVSEMSDSGTEATFSEMSDAHISLLNNTDTVYDDKSEKVPPAVFYDDARDEGDRI